MPGNPFNHENSCWLAFALKRLVPHQPGQWRCVKDTVTTANEAGIPGRWVIRPGCRVGAEGWDWSTAGGALRRVDPGLVEQLPELGFGPAQNPGATPAPGMPLRPLESVSTPRTGSHRHLRIPEGTKSPKNALERLHATGARYTPDPPHPSPAPPAHPGSRKPPATPDAAHQEQLQW